MSEPNGFLEDGYDQTLEATEPRIRLDVLKEFAECLQTVSPQEQAALKREIEAEIQKRLKKMFPPNTLF